MKSMVAVLAAAGVLISSGAAADEAAIKREIERRFDAPGVSVSKTPYAGLYEVLIDGRIVYTDESVGFFINGDVIDARTSENLTQKKLFSTLPFDDAVKVVRGSGKRTLVTFEDPNCSYCKKLAKDLQGLNDVTIYTFLYPILSQDSMEKSRAVWCAPDRAKAWTDLMVKNVVPAAKGNCPNPIEKNVGLGARMNIRGTPTILLASGQRLPGAVPVAEIEKALAAAR
jgi:thiol:disulfide interchange protein DsbC